MARVSARAGAWLALLAGCQRPADFESAFAGAARITNVTSFAVARDGATEREQYFNGAGPDTAGDVRSVTKSVVALAVGAALDEGCLRSLDQTLGDCLGALAPADAAKSAIRLRDLLTMSSGLAWSEDGADGYNPWASAPDQVDYVLARDVVASPGTTFDYDSGAFHLLSVALTLQCGPTATFVGERLLAPLGAASRPWETDGQGFTNGAAGLQLTTREMIAIGDLVVDAGARGKVQVVPAAFVDAATRAQIPTGGSASALTPAYGFGWWVGTTPGGRALAMAAGYGGQFIVVVPDARVVVVATARWMDVGTDTAATQFAQLLSVLDEDVLPQL